MHACRTQPTINSNEQLLDKKRICCSHPLGARKRDQKCTIKHGVSTRKHGACELAEFDSLISSHSSAQQLPQELMEQPRQISSADVNTSHLMHFRSLGFQCLKLALIHGGWVRTDRFTLVLASAVGSTSIRSICFAVRCSWPMYSVRQRVFSQSGEFCAVVSVSLCVFVCVYHLCCQTSFKSCIPTLSLSSAKPDKKIHKFLLQVAQSKSFCPPMNTGSLAIGVGFPQISSTPLFGLVYVEANFAAQSIDSHSVCVMFARVLSLECEFTLLAQIPEEFREWAIIFEVCQRVKTAPLTQEEINKVM